MRLLLPLVLTASLAVACRSSRRLEPEPYPVSQPVARSRPSAPTDGGLPTALRRARRTPPDAGGDASGEVCSVGVPACDEYLAKFTACMDMRSPDQRDMVLRSLETMCQAWRQVARAPANHQQLEQACVTAMQAAQRWTATWGCVW